MGNKIVSVLRSIGLVLLLSMFLAVVGYVLFNIVFSTDDEKHLWRENRLYSKMYEEMVSRENLVSDVIASLEVRDNEIFNELFNVDAPPVDPVSSMFTPSPLDSTSLEDIVSASSRKASSLMESVSGINADFAKILLMLTRSDYVMPPMILPIEGISYPQTGASIGMKTNPFYKTEVLHEGLDLMASQGTAVHATADGVVTEVRKSVRGLGNYVVISHPGGYTTLYAHLSEINVWQGSNVRRGQRIGLVGRTGKVFAPHLHYELRRDGVLLDPVNYLFGSISAEDYANILFSASNTKQSMD